MSKQKYDYIIILLYGTILLYSRWKTATFVDNDNKILSLSVILQLRADNQIRSKRAYCDTCSEVVSLNLSKMALSKPIMNLLASYLQNLYIHPIKTKAITR